MVDSRYLVEMFSRVCEILQGENILNVWRQMNIEYKDAAKWIQ